MSFVERERERRKPLHSNAKRVIKPITNIAATSLLLITIIASASCIVLMPNVLPVSALTEEELVRVMLVDYYDAFNRHSVADEVAFFTDTGVKMLEHGAGGTFTGHAQISAQLAAAFAVPDIALVNVYLTKLVIVGSTATVQTTFLVTGTGIPPGTYYTEDMTIVKSSAWMISVTDVYAGHASGGEPLLRPAPVGGYVMPVNRLAILAPYLALVGLVSAATAAIAFKKKHKD